MKSFPWKYVLTSILAFTLASVALAYVVEVIMHAMPGNHPPYNEALPTGLLFGFFLSVSVVAKQYEFIKTNEGEVTAKNIYPKRMVSFYYNADIPGTKKYLKSIAGERTNWSLKKEESNKLILKAKSRRGPSSYITMSLKQSNVDTEVTCTIKNGFSLLPVDYGHTHECLHKLEDSLGKKIETHAG